MALTFTQASQMIEPGLLEHAKQIYARDPENFAKHFRASFGGLFHKPDKEGRTGRLYGVCKVEEFAAVLAEHFSNSPFNLAKTQKGENK